MKCTCAILSSVACPAVQYFSTLSHKHHEFRKKLLNTKCEFWLFLQNLSETSLILSRTERDMIINVYWSSGTEIVILVRIKRILNFSTHFWKLINIKFNENPSSGSRDVPGGRTDMRNLIVAFHNFATTPKNVK